MQLPAILVRPRRGWVLCLASWFVFWGGYVFSEVLLASDHREGFYRGLVFTPFMALPAFLLLLLVPTLLLLGLWKWRRWNSKYRTVTVLSLSFLLTALVVIPALISWAWPASRFESYYGAQLPSEVKDFRASFAGTGFFEPQNSFSFETTPEGTKALLAAHSFQEITQDANLLLPEASSGWPDPRTWPGLKSYISHLNPQLPVIYYFYTDQSMTKVFIIVVGF